MFKFSTTTTVLNKKVLENTIFKSYKKNISVTFLYNDINQFQIIVPNTITFDNVLDDWINKVLEHAKN